MNKGLAKGIAKYSFLILVLSALGFFLFNFISSVNAPEGSGAVISTDKSDYLPGDTVLISGSGFSAASESNPVQITITRPDGNVTVCPVEYWCPAALPTTSSFSGYEYKLDGIEGTYTVDASDGTNSAQTTFSDSRSITGATLNGASNVVVAPSASITAAVTVSLSSGDDWEGTGYRIGNGTWQCADTPDHSSGTGISESFAITAPSSFGAYNVEFRASGNDNCSSPYGSTRTLTSGIRIIQPNPVIPACCGIDIALVIDTSGSINSAELAQMKTALVGFVDALSGTPTQFSVTRFSSTATVIQTFTNNFTSVKAAINGVGSTGSGATNWQAAISTARGTFDPRTYKPNLMIFASDGNPTYPDCGGSTTCPADVDSAVIEANIAKSSPLNIRILTVGIGDGLIINNLEAISGTNVNTGVTSDVITTDFSTLAHDLAALANQFCGGTISVKKLVDGQDANGWNFTTSVTGGLSIPTYSITGPDGFINPIFNITNITGPSATASVTETSQGGYSFVSAHCYNNSVEVGTNGTGTVTGIVIGQNDSIYCEFSNSHHACDSDAQCSNLNTACADGVCNLGTHLCEQSFKSAATVCRASAGVCDLAEMCTGSSADCPADAKSTAVCRPSAGQCDLAENCDGINNNCPADGFKSASFECRAQDGICDVADYCSGSSASCPDALQPAQTVCRASAGDCDVAEVCDGLAKSCPTDSFISAGTECRASAGVCDVAETCTGSSAACPANEFQPSTTLCRASAGVCDVADYCSGLDYACGGDIKSTAVCRPSVGQCDVAESCDGTNNDCPANGYQPAGTACDDGTYCNGHETCNGAENCQAGTSVSCSGFNLPAIATCDNTPDDNYHPTYDTRSAFTSVCVEDGSNTGHCTDGSSIDVINTCNKATCGAECEQSTDCNSKCLDGVWKHAGSCQGNCICSYTSTSCDDGIACTVDSCDSVNGCSHTPNNAACDDGNSCTIDTCNVSSGCVHTVSDTTGPTTSDVVPTPYFNNGIFNVTATATDACSNIQTSEYFVGHGLGFCGLPGTGTPMFASDGNFDEMTEGIYKNNAQFFMDGVNYICIQSKDTSNNWGNCACAYYETDIIPPDCPYNINLDDTKNPKEYLVCGDNTWLNASVCDSQANIQGGEYFLDITIPPIPAPWSGVWMDVLEVFGGAEGPRCAVIGALVNTSNLTDGTHYINIRGKDAVENWGKMSECGQNISFIKDTTAPITTKTLNPADGKSVACSNTTANGKTLTDGCNYVKQGTTITLNASDPDPQGTGEHAGNVVIHYNVYWSEDGSSWSLILTDQSDVNQPVTIKLKEDSYHLIEYWATDGCNLAENHHYELDIVDTQAPVTEKTVGNPKIAGDGFDYWITQQTPITLSCSDPQPHPVDNVILYARYKVDGGEWVNLETENGYVKFTFPEDSVHTLEYYCVDALGNTEATHTEVDKVDSTPPTTTKTYGTPYVTSDGKEWINSSTPITLTSVDGGNVCAVGVDEIQYRVSGSLADKFCNDCENWMSSLRPNMGAWQTYENPFTIPDQSCHVIEYRSIDDLGNTEKIKWQCVFVDNTGPLAYKKLGSPVYTNDETTWVNQSTPITLTCEDQSPHPVGADKAYYRIYNDGELVQDWTLYEGPFQFTEDTTHTLEYKCVDKLGNVGPTNNETDIVDSQPPLTTKSFDGPNMAGDGFTWITQNTNIVLSCTDPDPHPVDHTTIYYRYNVDDGEYNAWTEYTAPFHFTEDSNHSLQYYCVDALGNTEATHTEIDKVDSTPPTTNKTYGTPFYTDGTSDWITSSTPITLSATDGGDVCAIGVDETNYRYTIVDNSYCLNQELCQEYDGVIDKAFDKSSPYLFSISEDSCHLIEYFSVDQLGNTEDVKRQCVFVDNTPPVTDKTVGSPKYEGTGDVNWWVTQQTQITLTCEDQSPHPVGADKIYYRIYNEDVLVKDWTLYEGQFRFTEDSKHTLEYKCVDILGNTENVKTEIDQVDTKGPDIVKWVNDTTVRPGDTVKICANVTDKKLTGDAGVGVDAGSVNAILTLGEDPAGISLTFVEGNTYCGEWTAPEIKNCYWCHGLQCEYKCAWDLSVEATDLLGNYNIKDGLQIIVDNAKPEILYVLNPVSGNYYRDGKAFSVYAPAIDFGGDTNVYNSDNCKASGVKECRFYAVDYPYEIVNQSEVKNYWDYLQQLGNVYDNPNVVYLGSVPYINGVCKGTVSLPEDSNITDKAFLAYEIEDNAGNVNGMDLAKDFNGNYILMDIDNAGPQVNITAFGNTPGPLKSGDNIQGLRAEITDPDSGFVSCDANLFKGDTDTGIIINGRNVGNDVCEINGIIPAGLVSGTDYNLRVYAVDTVGNVGYDWASLIIDNTPPVKTVFEPHLTWYNNILPINISATDETSGIDDSKVYFNITHDYCVFLWCNTVNDISGVLDNSSKPYYTSQVNITGFEDGSEHKLSITVCDLAGNCIDPTITFRVDHTAPTSPGSLTIADSPIDGDGNVYLSWTAATDSLSGVSYYNVVMDGALTNGTNITSTHTHVASTNDVFTNLTDGTYTFIVTAVDAAGNEGPGAVGSTVVQIGYVPLTPPAPSGGSTGGSSSGSISVGGGGASTIKSLSITADSSMTINAGSNNSITLKVTNNGNVKLNDVRISFAGVGDWITINPISASINAGSSVNYVATIAVPSSEKSEVKTITFAATSSDGTTASKIVTLNVLAAEGQSLPVCGNGICEFNEDGSNCCIDCGCSNGYVCTDNACEQSPKLQGMTGFFVLVSSPAGILIIVGLVSLIIWMTVFKKGSINTFKKKLIFKKGLVSARKSGVKKSHTYKHKR